MDVMSLIALAILPGVVRAAEPCAQVPANYQILLDCAEVRSPEIQNAGLELNAAGKQIKAAGQWKNPDLSLEAVQGEVAGQTRPSTDLSLGVPIELGGKIAARQAVAKGNAGLAEARLFQARAKVRAEVFLKLHRLRQVVHEREIVQEAIDTYAKLIRQYARRPGLSPEQQVASSVYQLAKGEYELRRNSNLDEEAALDSYFKHTVGFGVDQLKALVPQSPEVWPNFAPTKSRRLSPRERILQAELDATVAEFKVAKSESWPTLTVGPSLQMTRDARYSEQLVGVNIRLPIPVFNVNGGGRSFAAAQVQATEARKQFGFQELELAREELAKVYQQSVKSLSASVSHKEIEKRHRDAEKLFMRGIVPSALVIEAHRTSFELERTRHERELKALETLLGLYALEGTILEQKL